MRLSVVVSLYSTLVGEGVVGKIALVTLTISSISFLVIALRPHRSYDRIVKIAQEVAEKCRKGCEYSPKPVVVRGDFEKRFSVGGNIVVAVKKDRAFIKVKRRLFEKLSSPCLDEFARLFLERLLK